MNESRGAKGGRNDRKRSLKIKLSFLKKLKRINNKKKLPSNIKTLNIINLKYNIKNVLVEGYKKIKITKPRKENKVFDGIIMITSLLTILVPEKTTIKKEKTKEEKKLEKIEEAKIVEKYSNKLKEIRTDLRETSFEQKLLQVEEKETKQVDVTINKLNNLIEKVDTLEEKIASPENEKYNSDYLYVIVDEYLDDFKNSKEVEEITTSPLFIDISNKIEEVVEEKELIEEKHELKKEILNIDNKKLSKVKEDYQKENNFKEKINNFSKETKEEIEKLNEEIKKVEQKDTLKLRITHANRLLSLMMIIVAAQMIPNTKKTTTNLIISTSIVVVLLKRIINKNKKNINVDITKSIEDYSNQLEKELLTIDDLLIGINRSLNNVEVLLIQIRSDFHEYQNYPEYQELIDNLEKLRNDLNEKKYELDQEKKKQQDNIIKNKSRVKSYSM